MQKQKYTVFCIIILFFLMVLFVPAIFAAQKTTKLVMAEGVAAIKGENIEGARSDAIENALRNAVEQGLGTMMDAKAIVKNDQLLEQIFTHTRGYVAEYEVVREKKTGDNLYRVTISAVVKSAELKNKLAQLGIIKQMMDFPRLLIVPEFKSGDSEAVQAAGHALAGFFTDKRFDVAANAPVSLHNQSSKFSNNEPAILMQSTQAEIIVTYGLSSDPSWFDGIFENIPVLLSARAVATSTGQVLSSEQIRAFGLGDSKAAALTDGARKAAARLGDALSEDFLGWWVEYTANGLPYHIVLKTSSVNSRVVADFQLKLQSIPGVTALTEYSNSKGVIQMRLTFKGRAADLKQQILDTEPGIDFITSKGRYMELSFQ